MLDRGAALVCGLTAAWRGCRRRERRIACALVVQAGARLPASQLAACAGAGTIRLPSLHLADLVCRLLPASAIFDTAW